MKKIALFFCILMIGFVFSQEKMFGNKSPYEQADVFPEFPSGQSGFKTEFYKNLDILKLDKVQDYHALLEFIIEKDGSMSSIKSSGEYSLFNIEVINALKKIETKWKSAENANKKIRYHVNMPVFHYQKEHITIRVQNMFGEKKVDSKNVFSIVDQSAEFFGGTGKFKSKIKNELGNEIENYLFELNFIVEIDGSLSDIKIVGNNDEKMSISKKLYSTLKKNGIPLKLKDKM